MSPQFQSASIIKTYPEQTEHDYRFSGTFEQGHKVVREKKHKNYTKDKVMEFEKRKTFKKSGYIT